MRLFLVLQAVEDATKEGYQKLEDEQKEALAEFGVIKKEYEAFIKKNPLND